MNRFRVGPGFLVAAAFIGPGTIVTASRAGAGYGTTLLWAVLFSVVATVILQDMAARVGLAGRRGLAEAIRDSLASPLIRAGALGLIALTILGGNAAFQTGNLLGASLGISLLTGLPQALLVAIIGGLAGALLMTGTYKAIQNALVALVGVMSVVFCLIAMLTAPSLGELLSGFLLPRVPPGALLTVLALIGTTIVPYNLFLHASAALERWPDAERHDENIRESRWDTLFSMALGGLITAAVVIAASPLLGQGADAADAAAVAARLEPLLGRAGVLRNRALRRRPDFGDHGAAGRRLCGGRRDGLEGRPQERPLPSALEFRVADRGYLAGFSWVDRRTRSSCSPRPEMRSSCR